MTRGWLVLLVATVVAGALTYAIHDWLNGPEFTPAGWQEARAKDSKNLDLLATDAVESGALIGQSRSQLQRTLGPPDAATRRDRVWIWNIGNVNDGIGPGDEAFLRVRFDGRTGRSVKTAIGP